MKDVTSIPGKIFTLLSALVEHIISPLVDMLYKSFTREGKIRTLPENVDVIEKILVLRGKLRTAGIDVTEIDEQIRHSSIVIASELNKLLNSDNHESSDSKRSKRLKIDPKLKISISHPKLFAKETQSKILIQIYPSGTSREFLLHEIQSVVGQDAHEHLQDTMLTFGKAVKIKLFCPDISFSEPVCKKLDYTTNRIIFTATPTIDCKPGVHQILLSLLDAETELEYYSISFEIKVTDYVFIRVSRPLLSKSVSFIAGIGSVTMFILTLLEQIDKTVGLTAGTSVGVFALAIYANFHLLFQRVRT